MADLLIRLEKKRDGSVAQSCKRADGSVTWQRVDPRHGQFFLYHDLTHYAVESELGHRRGFYGLLAEGWEFTDFAAPWPRGKIPADAEPAELIVGLIDALRRSESEWTANDMNEYASTFLAQYGSTLNCPINQEQLARIRARMAELFKTWDALSAGEVLELEFNRGN